MGKKKFLLIAIVVSILVVVVLYVQTVPIYPSFQKEVATLEEIRTAFDGNVTFPVIDEVAADETSYQIIMDGRTIRAKPVGYVIESAKTDCKTDTRFSYIGSLGEENSQINSSEYAYRGVNINISYNVDKVDPTRWYCVIIHFSQGEWAYEFRGTCTRIGNIEITDDDQAQEEIQRKTNQMQSVLLGQCYEVIDESFDE